METVRGPRITGSGCEKDSQLWHKCVQYCICDENGAKGQVVVPMYSGILEQFYFFKSKKNLWHTWHTPILAYKCWYKRIIVCHGCWHSLAQLLVLLAFLIFALAQYCIRRAGIFLFFLKTFLPKNLPIQYIE